MSEQKKSLLERMLGGAKKKTQDNHDKLEQQVKDKLKKIVYEDELVEELAPIFVKFQGQEGFDKVFELIETKEAQVEYLSGGDWFKQETDPEAKEADGEETEDEGDALSAVDSILSKKYGDSK